MSPRPQSDAEFLEDLTSGPMHQDLVVVAEATGIGGVISWAIGGLWGLFRPVNLSEWVQTGAAASGLFVLTLVLISRIWP
jgi:hypothetical protein